MLLSVSVSAGYRGRRRAEDSSKCAADAPQSPAFQSLDQMKVPQHHCVPVSLWPEGPMGLREAS